MEGLEQIPDEELMFFNKYPRLLPIYIRLRGKITEEFGDVRIRVSKTQISFYNKHIFAMASLPLRRRRDWPKEFLMVTFGLEHPKRSDRIAMAVEAYPNRWTHHVIVATPRDVDDELMDFIRESYYFSLGKDQ